MKVLVTGGAGFIGSHLVDQLLDEGNEVDVVDNYVTGLQSNLRSRFGLTVYDIDVADSPLGRYDRVYHLASPASPIFYGRQQRRTLLTNALGTERTLSIAASSKAAYLLASTSEVYGDPQEHPQRESYWGHVNPIGPRSSYDEGKRFSEALAIAYVRELRTNARIVRIFNTYGPRMRIDDGRMPAAFVSRALRGLPLLVEGDGRQTRSLCHVRDTVAGMIAAMEHGASGDVYNLGNPREMSVRDFAEAVIRLSKSTSTIQHVPGRPEDIARRKPDVSKARSALGWEPRVDLEAGLTETISWYRQHLASGTT